MFVFEFKATSNDYRQVKINSARPYFILETRLNMYWYCCIKSLRFFLYIFLLYRMTWGTIDQ